MYTRAKGPRQNLRCAQLGGSWDCSGHANASITSAYLHVAVDDDAVGELFRF
jgi:hypothetical protein